MGGFLPLKCCIIHKYNKIVFIENIIFYKPKRNEKNKKCIILTQAQTLIKEL